MRQLKRILSIIDNISDWSGKICSFAVVFILVFITYEVVMRYVFNSPTVWVFETVQFLFGGAFILSGAYVLRHKAHVNMDIICNRFSPRTRAILDLVTSVLFFSFCAVVFWWGIRYAGRSLELREISYTPFAPPLYPIKMTIPIAAALILLQGLAKSSRDVIIAITGKEAP